MITASTLCKEALQQSSHFQSSISFWAVMALLHKGSGGKK